MATRDSGDQQQASRTQDEAEARTHPRRAAISPTAERAQLDEDIDAILDEIDDVLETNAEEFVRAFVQKGGQ